MLLSKPNLLISKVASKDSREAADLQFLHVAADGSTIATDSRIVLACSPIDPETQFPDIGPLADPPALGANIRPEIVNQAIKNMPKEFILQTAAMTRCDDQRIELTTVDRQKIQRTEGLPIRQNFPRWRDLFKAAWNRITAYVMAGEQSVTICLPRKRLIRLLQAMDAASGDKNEDSPVFISFGGPKDAVILRAKSYATKQSLIGLATPIDAGEAGHQFNKWERLVLGIMLEKKQKAIRRK